MKHILKTFIFIFVFILSATKSFSQAPIRDRWDTLYANVDYLNTTSYLYQTANIAVGNKLIILSDSIDGGNSASYLQSFNTSNNSLTTINYTRQFSDQGTNGGAAYTTNTTNLSYVFFGAKTFSYGTTFFSLYKYNTLTNAVTSETVAIPANDNRAIENVGFFSPNTNHDSLIIFAQLHMVNDDSIYIYKKHYNQTGILNSNVKLPIKLDKVTKVMVFNNVLYVAGYQYPDNGKLLKSNDGLTFTVITNYETNYTNKYVVDMDTLNNKLYLGLKSSGQGYDIIETADGNNFTTIINNTYSWAINSLKNYKKTIWFSYYQYYGNKQANTNQNTMSLNMKASYVGYIKFPSNTEEMSIDTLGRFFNQGETFKLQKVNSKLLLAGNYYDNNFSNTPGNFVYEFKPPVANFTVSGTNVCLFANKSYVNQSTNADSVRWIYDNNYYAALSNTYNTIFTSVGNHTLGLIAISGTQKDTLKYTINVYSVTVNMPSSINSCIHNTTTISPTTPGAFAPITYTWSTSSTLSTSSISNSTIGLMANASGNYTYMLSVKDVNNCSAYSAVGNLTIGSNKDIVGAVTVTSSPLTTGSVTLYKYEPFLTKFDSITSQPLNASGTYTFAGQDAFTYIMKCEPNNLSLENTYAPSETSWKTAAHVTHGCTANLTQNINVIPLTNIGTGPGTLSGKITEGQGYQPRGGIFAPGQPIGGLSIKGGRNPGGNIVAQGRTNSSGEYTLSNIPVSGTGETYFILVDVPGLDTNTTYHVAITTSSLQYNDLNFIVDSAKINPTSFVGIKQFSLNNSRIKIYPNPTSGLVNINIDLSTIEKVSIKLVDIMGKDVKTILSPTNFSSNLKVNSNLNGFNPGIYFLKLAIGDAEQTVKIVITD